MSNEIYLRLLLSQIILSGLSTAPAMFFKSIYPAMTANQYLSGMEMAEVANMSQQMANKHAKVLTKYGFLKRRHYRAWQLNDAAITDPYLIKLMRLSNSL